MRIRTSLLQLSAASVLLLSGCAHRVPAPVTVATPPPPAPAGPVVMVSVPPPTHHSVDASGEVPVTSDIPVMKPVRPPRRPFRRPAPAQTTAAVPAPVTTPPVAAATPPPALDLGQLTTSTSDPSATRDGATQALRRERDRIAAVPAAVQAAHPAELEHANRFLRAASESLNASDYVGTLALTTKARVLLDDLLK